MHSNPSVSSTAEGLSELDSAAVGRVLVVDDQRNMRTTLAMMLRGSGFDVDEAEDGAHGSEMGASGAYDVVITDIKMGDCDGIDVLRAVKSSQPTTQVILMTAYGTIESAVEAMRLGAFEYIQKPFSEEELLSKVKKGLESRRQKSPTRSWSAEFRRQHHLEHIVGRSAAMRDVFSRVIKIAPTDATVLITGESGTGKELIARAVHANSRRAHLPFVTVNCAAITETLLESELFGHARGAFTGAVSARKGLLEEANGGTFFFDEIAETTMSFQAKLLRAIQDGEIKRVGENKPISVDARIVAATNVDLASAVEERRFRQDLFYRLNVVRFTLPPLRERRADIPPLAEFFLDRYTKKMQVEVELADGLMEHLMAYDYPGNVRELENMVEQAVALCAGGTISAADIMPQAPRPPTRGKGRTLADIVDEAEREAVEAALRACDGSRERAAEALDISPTTLWRKMTRLGITFDNR